MATYEFAKAQEFSASNPDNIYYDKDAAFRNQDYRQVFHQDGTIGTFSVRLLEAADLSRNYWSALALGPMKHLGLSKAHGGVSSFISFCLDTTATSKYKRATSVNDYDQKMPSKKSAADRHDYSSFVSPVVPNDNNPVWTNCQFEIPLKKGALQDGQPVRIALRVDEDATTIENIIPGMPKGDARFLGIGNLDVTSLCLGQNPATGRPTTGVIDTWVPIRLAEDEQEFDAYDSLDEKLLLHNNKKVAPPVDYDLDKKVAASTSKGADNESGSTARVRVSITYTPHGMRPRKNDVVALEAFARQNSSSATCSSILPPLLPLHVVEFTEPWLLVRYSVPDEAKDRGFLVDEALEDRKKHMRIHRNAVFVIERKNLVDGALNLALQPAELLLNTPLGQGAREVLGPVLVASKQLLMPALVSSKLLWMAVRTTALAGITGVSAASSAFVNEGTNSLTKDNNRRRSVDVSRVRYV
mmetsp:Transcript_7021/g.17132  ORF Transcript_7021/g.17132 Transcript_7021/m.17132 type:complete len:470 (-) Transcript_7021:948-2357(-)